MAFIPNGPTIEVSTSHLNLLGTELLAGVTRIGDDNGAGGFFAYEMDGINIKLLPGSFLRINPEENILIFKANCPYPLIDYADGTLQIGERILQNGKIKYTYGTAIVRTGAVTNGFDTTINGTIVSTSDNGTFIGYGGSIITRGPLSLSGQANQPRDGTVTIESLNITQKDIGQFRLDNNPGQPINISGLTIDGLRTLFASDFQNFSAIVIDGSIQTFFNASTDNTLEDISFANNTGTLDFIFNGNPLTDMVITTFKNLDVGSGIRAEKTSANNNDDAIQIIQDVRFRSVDRQGNSVIGYKVYATQVDDGNRRDPRRTISVDWMTSREYYKTGDLAGEALIAFQTCTIIPTQGVIGQSGYSYRTSGQDNTDSQFFHAWSYGHEPITTPQESIKTNGEKVIRLPFDVDSNVTESDISVVNAITDFTTPDQVYDRAQSWKIDGIDNLKYPAPDVALAKASGATLDFGDLNLVFDAAAAAHFAVNTTTNVVTAGSTTISSGAIFTALKTTGTVIIDSVGEGLIIRDSSLVSITDLPDVLTLDNTILELAPGDDITQFVELNNAFYLATDDGTYIARGKSAGIIDANGFNIIVETEITLQAQTSGYMANSRVLIKNKTTGTVLFNDKIVGNTYDLSYAEGGTITQGDVIEVFSAFTNATNSYYGKGTSIAGADGVTILVSEEEFTDYAEKGIDGSTVTDYALNEQNIHVDINATNGNWSIPELSAWYRWQMFDSPIAIAQFFNLLVAVNQTAYIFDASTLNLKLDNTGSNDVFETTGYSLRRNDGALPFISPTTGGGAIYFKYRADAIAVPTDAGGLDEAALHTGLDNYANKDDYKAENVNTDLTPVLNAISALNDPTPAEIRAAFDAVEFQDKNTEAEFHAWLASFPGKDDYKADTGGGTLNEETVTEIRSLLSAIDSRLIKLKC